MNSRITNKNCASLKVRINDDFPQTFDRDNCDSKFYNRNKDYCDAVGSSKKNTLEEARFDAQTDRGAELILAKPCYPVHGYTSHNYNLNTRKCDAADWEIEENVNCVRAFQNECKDCLVGTKCNQSDVSCCDTIDEVCSSDEEKQNEKYSIKTESISEDEDLKTGEDTELLRDSTSTESEYISDWEEEEEDEIPPPPPTKKVPRFVQLPKPNSSIVKKGPVIRQVKEKDSLEDIVRFFKKHGLDIRDAAKHDPKLLRLLEQRLPEVGARVERDQVARAQSPSWYIQLRDDEICVLRRLRAYLDPVCPVKPSRTIDSSKIISFLNQLDLGPKAVERDDVRAAVRQCSRADGRVDFDEFLLTLATEYLNWGESSSPLYTRRQQVLYSAIAQMNAWTEMEERFHQSPYSSKCLRNVLSPREKTNGLFEAELQRVCCKLRKIQVCCPSTRRCPYAQQFMPILSQANRNIPWEKKWEIREMKKRKIKILEQLPESHLIPELRKTKESSSLWPCCSAFSKNLSQQRAESCRAQASTLCCATTIFRREQFRECRVKKEAFASDLWNHLKIESLPSRRLRFKYKKFFTTYFPIPDSRLHMKDKS